LTTTGSVDSVDATISVLNGPVVQAFTIEPQDFEHSGRDKSFSKTFFFVNGSYAFEVCGTQSGAQGRTSKGVCATYVFTVAC